MGRTVRIPNVRFVHPEGGNVAVYWQLYNKAGQVCVCVCVRACVCVHVCCRSVFFQISVQYGISFRHDVACTSSSVLSGNVLGRPFHPRVFRLLLHNALLNKGGEGARRYLHMYEWTCQVYIYTQPRANCGRRSTVAFGGLG